MSQLPLKKTVLSQHKSVIDHKFHNYQKFYLILVNIKDIFKLKLIVFLITDS